MNFSALFIGATCACAVVAACGGTVEKRNQSDSGATGGAGAATSFGGSGGLSGGTSVGGSGAVGAETGGFGAAAGGTSFGGFGPGGATDVGGFPSTGGAPPADAGTCRVINGSNLVDVPELDLVFVVDQSLAMGCTAPNTNETPWSAMTGALEDFAQKPTRTSVDIGLDFFGRPPATDAGPGRTSSCFATDYQFFDMSLAPVPAHFTDVTSWVSVHAPSTDGALSAAFAGAMSVTVELAAQNPTNKYAVVLMTGTEPDVCQGTPPVDTAATGLMSGVETFVITAAAPSNTCAPNAAPSAVDLNAVAAAGGTKKAQVLGPPTALGGQALAAIQAIANQFAPPAPSCAYDLGSAAPRPNENVLVVGGTAAGDAILNQVSKGTCDPDTGGWYYDDPKSPTTVRLCDESCKVLTASGSNTVILIGCANPVLPP